MRFVTLIESQRKTLAFPRQLELVSWYQSSIAVDKPRPYEYTFEHIRLSTVP